MIPSKVMAKMATAGLSEEQAELVASMLSDVEAATRSEAEAIIEQGREKARDRWHKWDSKRRANVSKRLLTVANASQQLARTEDKTSSSEIEPQESKKEQKETREAALFSFEAFWAEYPNKVGKPKAKAAFVAALRKASSDAIMAGLRRYVASKPADRAWLNPTTFLNQERWTDEPAMPVARGSPAPRANPALEAANRLMEKLNAVAPGETQSDQSYPRLVALPGGR